MYEGLVSITKIMFSQALLGQITNIVLIASVFMGMGMST